MASLNVPLIAEIEEENSGFQIPLHKTTLKEKEG